MKPSVCAPRSGSPAVATESTAQLDSSLAGEAPPVVGTAPAGAPTEPALKPAPTLTRRASLTAAASLLDYGAKAGVSLVITPILVSGLGRVVYGVWEMLARLGSYMSATDGRPTEALRLIVAQREAETDQEPKRRQIGASLAVWALTLPLVFVIGGALAWFVAPSLTRSHPELRGDVRMTVLLIVLTFIL